MKWDKLLRATTRAKHREAQATSKHADRFARTRQKRLAVTPRRPVAVAAGARHAE